MQLDRLQVVSCDYDTMIVDRHHVMFLTCATHTVNALSLIHAYSLY